MRILGIDPGTEILGFGFIDKTSTKPKLVDAGVIRTPAKHPDKERLAIIYNDLKELIEQYQPDVMVVEKLFFAKNVTTGMSVSQARGVVLLLAEQYKLQLEEYTPMQIKQALTGYGKAGKKQVQEMVKLQLNLKEIPRPDDAADALAAALTFA
jgi:crossover junction endodeoxyribonuclease RuvC